MREAAKRDRAFWRQAVLYDGTAPYSFHCDGQRCDGEHPAPAAESIGVECARRSFPESECVEWALRFRNTGTTDTALLSELQSLDLALSPPPDVVPVVIHAVHGCSNGDAPFALERIVPERGTTWRIGNPGGGKTGSYPGAYLPFINLSYYNFGPFRIFLLMPPIVTEATKTIIIRR